MPARGVATRVGWLLALMLAVTLGLGAPATAGGDEGAPCTTASGQPGHIVANKWGVSICVPDQSTEGGVTPGTPGNPGEGVAVCYDGNKPIPCVTSAGVWYSSQHCYANVADPQPPADSAIWGGNDPTKGRMWVCSSVPGSETGQSGWFYVGNGSTPALIEPGVLAWGAVAQMDFEYAQAKIAPGPAWHTFIGIENWLWIPASQWRVLSLRVSAAGTTVTVNATPTSVQWNMGSDTISCYDPGRPWVKGMSDEAKTTCGYTYDDIADPEGDIHRVVARIVYEIDWTCSGACLTTSGTLDAIRARAGAATSIEVLQRQTVNVS